MGAYISVDISNALFIELNPEYYKGYDADGKLILANVAGYSQ